MKGFSPTFLDKLLGDATRKPNNASLVRLSIEQLKDSVAVDLEALLNTRAVFSELLLADYPECSRSIMSYGLTDFAGLSLTSGDDRVFICRALEQTIARHEPRLRNVRASLEIDEQKSINKLNFSITALLVVSESTEPVSFDAFLLPSTLQYSINSSKRTSAVRLGV
jgi:type VI secretion system protein ImpF